MQTYSIKIQGSATIYDINANNIDNLRKNLIQKYDGKSIFVYTRYTRYGVTNRRYIGTLHCERSYGAVDYLWGDSEISPQVAISVNPKTGKLMPSRKYIFDMSYKPNSRDIQGWRYI